MSTFVWIDFRYGAAHLHARQALVADIDASVCGERRSFESLPGERISLLIQPPCRVITTGMCASRERWRRRCPETWIPPRADTKTENGLM